MKHPRPYQSEGTDAMITYLCEEDGDPLYAAPTGTGKSLSICHFIRKSIEADPSTRFIVAAPNQEIVSQNAEELSEFWPRADYGIFCSGLKRKDTKNAVIFGSIQSIYNKVDKFGHVDCLIADEAHTIGPKDQAMWQQFIAGLRAVNPDMRVVGYTATPYRLSSGCLVESGLFTKLVVDHTSTEMINWFVSEGYLAPLISKKPSIEIDITQIAMRGGEFDDHSLALAADKEEINRAVVSECIRYGQDRNHWLLYASGRDHSKHLQEMFLSKGVTCETIDGTMSKEQRTYLIGDRTKKIQGAFQQGKFRALINVDVLSTGFNFPALDLIGLVQATQSVGKYIQRLGRGTRPYPGKSSCLILDFGSNIVRLGPFNAPCIPKPRKKGDAVAGEAPIKVCPECSSYCHTRAVVCPDCGFEFPPPQTLEAAASQAPVMVDSAQKPVIEIMQVKSTHYQDRPAKAPGCGPLVRVSYSDGFLHTVSEVFCPEPNPAFQWQRDVVFVKFWYAAGGKRPPPLTAAEFVERARSELKAPKQVYFESNVRHPKVTKREY